MRWDKTGSTDGFLGFWMEEGGCAVGPTVWVGFTVDEI